MDENNILKKKKSHNNYRHHYNQNKYYKNKKKKNLILDNNDTVEIKNILLYNETTPVIPKIENFDVKIKKQDMPKVEIPIIKAYELLREKEDLYEEDVVPKIKKKKNINIINKNVLKYGMSFALLLLVIFGTSYSYFNYTKEDVRQADISSGDIYVRLVEDTQSISLNKMYPRTLEEARSRNDNYIDFTIKGMNTSETKAVLYSLNIENGEDVVGKTRIDSKYIKLDLEEKVNNDYYYIKEGVSLSDFSFTGIIPTNSTSEITKEYRLRLWIGDEVSISNTDSNATFTQTEFNNLFANYNISIDSRDKIVAYSMFDKNADTETTINFANPSSDTNGNGLYVLHGTENNSFPIYYYRGNVNNNNVIFGDYCWQIVRTTDTGGIKMIYNGEVTGNGNTCENTAADDRIISKSLYKNGGSSMSDIGYMYNDRYVSINGLPPSGSIFGKDIKWDGTNYLVVDDNSLVPSTNTSFNNTHHYTCGTEGTTTCDSVRFYFYSGYSKNQYITLRNGETLEDVLYKMTGNGTETVKARNVGYELNKNDSTIKTEIEDWFKNNLTNEVNVNNIDYSVYVEDTVFCNDRKYQQSGKTIDLSGWNPNGGTLDEYLYFNVRTRAFNNWYSTTNVPSMTCPNETDRFSLSNSKAKIKYPIGLLTLDEIILAGLSGNITSAPNSTYYLYTGDDYWSMSPSYMYHTSAFVFYVFNDGSIVNYYVGGELHGVRPVISLKLGIEFEPVGDGTPTNPYIVKYN